MQPMPDEVSGPVELLLKLHAIDRLRSYQGNLASAVHVVKNDWLPSVNDEGVRGFLATLRLYLAQTGNPEQDEFVLRLGLTAPGVQRGVVPPLLVLKENRGGFSVRRQREAEGKIRRLQEALVIGRYFFPELTNDTQQAVVELANMCEGKRAVSDTDWIHRFRELTSTEADELSRQSLLCLDENEEALADIGTHILQRIACFRDASLSESTCRSLIEKRIFWPTSMYRDSGNAVATELIELIDVVQDQLALNHILLALAWTRSNTALQAFWEWSRNPPAWMASLHVAPKEYLTSAGWSLADDGNRRDLISLKCFRLEDAKDSAAGRIHCRTMLEESCPSCGGPQTMLFNFSELDGQFFPGELADAPRKISCCLHCSCYVTGYTRYGADGVTEWLLPVEQSEFKYEPADGLERGQRTLATSPIPPFACSEPFDLCDASTLGGIPMWLQDSEFPRCLECGQLMTFLAQHDNGFLGEEGIYYAFFCADCHVAAVNYQQT